MVTVHLAHTEPINPPGARPVLTAAQAWAGLARKARRPQDFVPVVESCTILSETEDPEVVRCVITFRPESGVAHAMRFTETCTLGPPCRLDYDMEDGSKAVNVIGTGPGGEEDPYLTFIFRWEHPNVQEGSEEAVEVERKHRKVTSVSVANTIASIRRLVQAGEL